MRRAPGGEWPAVFARINGSLSRSVGHRRLNMENMAAIRTCRDLQVIGRQTARARRRLVAA